MSNKEDLLDKDVTEEKINEETTAEENTEQAEEQTASEEAGSEEKGEEAPELSQEEETFKSQLQRLQAEFLNYKKRVEKEKIELSSFVKGEFVKRFLPVLDDIERLRSNIDADEATVKEALQMVFKKVDDFTSSEKIEYVGVEGEAFDPNLHEALMQVPTDEEEKDEFGGLTLASIDTEEEPDSNFGES